MLTITIPAIDLFDDVNGMFIKTNTQILVLEHSLVSLSRWESKWHKPFLNKDSKTMEETIDYIRCMTITQNVDSSVYKYISEENIKLVRDYIEESMTATTFNSDKQKGNKEVITAEIIYYWMISMTIPFECQKWHLNRLLTLINVCNIKNAPPKKYNKKETLSNNAALNAARKSALNTGG